MTGLWSRTSGALDNKLLNTPLPPDIPIWTDLLRDKATALPCSARCMYATG